MTKDRYIKDIKILEWFNYPIENQKIVFKDRVEYRKNGILHRLEGAAIEFKDKTKSKYYLEGIEYDEKKFKLKLRKYKTKKILKDDEKIN